MGALKRGMGKIRMGVEKRPRSLGKVRYWNLVVVLAKPFARLGAQPCEVTLLL